MTENPRPCLYCESITNNKTDEHVLQQGFGTSWKLTEDVCGDCNTTKFSHLDGDLIRFARNHGYWDYSDSSFRRTILQEGHHLWLDEQSGICFSVRIQQDGAAVCFPQIIFFSETEIQFLTDEAKNPVSFEQVMAELQYPERLKTEVRIVDWRSQDLSKVQPAIIRSAPNTYLICASSQEEASYLKDVIDERILCNPVSVEDENNRKILPPSPIYSRIIVNLGHIKRALAKSALNFLCAAVGPEVARYSCFSELRDFIMREYSAAQPEFVQPLWGIEKEQHWSDFYELFSKEGHHILVLSEVERIPHLFFLLYSRPFAVVRFLRESPVPILGPEGTRIAFFNYRTRTHSVLTGEQLAYEMTISPSPFNF